MAADPPGVDAELDRIWALVPGHDPRPDVVLDTATISLPSAFRVDTVATASVAASVLGAATLGHQRVGGSSGAPSGGRQPITVAPDHALASFTGWLRLDGEPIPTWADLSGRYATADGRFVQIHANFPHHAAGVAARLGVSEDRDSLAIAIAGRNAEELERHLIAADMICAVYRTLDEWAGHPHAAATADLPLIQVTELGPAPALDWPTRDGPGDDRATLRDAPLTGLRVLDCTRVLAGPVCGQTLAAHGAEVLRIGAAHLPSIPMGVMTTGFGKRNAFVDLRAAAGRDTFTSLVGGADVVIDAYRPGAVAGHGFGADSLARIRPGIVVVELCAFDWTGPWAGRRGFDSIIQTTTGLALAGAEAATTADDPLEPVHLPVQALDYATGYLAAFAAQRLVAHQRRVGGSWRARLSLLRTRNWLASLGGPDPFTPAAMPELSPWLHTVDSPFGRIEAVRPVAGRWNSPPAPLGSSPPAWMV